MTRSVSVRGAGGDGTSAGRVKTFHMEYVPFPRPQKDVGGGVNGSGIMKYSWP